MTTPSVIGWTSGDAGLAAGVAGIANADGAAFDAFDILVTGAAATHLPTPMAAIDGDDVDRPLRIDSRLGYLTARSLVPQMRERGAAVILATASTAGPIPLPGLSGQSASGGGINAATRAMALEPVPHVRADALCPAGEIPLPKSFPREDTPAMRAKFLATIPPGRSSTAQGLAAAAAIPCRDVGMTAGAALGIDGGGSI